MGSAAPGRTDEVSSDAVADGAPDPFLEELPREEPAYTTEVRGYRVRRTDETPAYAETIDVRESATTLDSLGEVLSRAVGVEVRSSGGLGAHGSVSIRGSTARQVPVYLDGVEVQSGGTSAVDLGDFSLDAFDTIEVYRGGAPLTAGGAGIGGALHLETRACRGPAGQGAVTYGSWRTWRGFGTTCAPLGDVSALALISARGSQGDFPFLNRNGTLTTPSDDRVARRSNNDHVAYTALLKLEIPGRRWRWTIADTLLGRSGGIPGVESVPTRRASSRTLGDGITLRGEGPLSDAVRLEVLAGYSGKREAFLNPALEFNQTALQITSRTHATEAGALGEVQWSRTQDTVVSVRNRFETFAHEERVGEVTDGTAAPLRRIRTDIGLQHDYRPRPSLLLSPLVRLLVNNARYPGGPNPTGDGALDPVSRNDVYWSPALGARWEVLEGLVLRANGGRYVRSPDLAELFGYSGSVMGNPDLREEVGFNGDLGATFERRGPGAISHLRLNGAGFGSVTDDLIAYEQTSQNAVRPDNIGRALVVGAEGSLSVALLEALLFDTNYTYLYGIDRSDTPYYRGNRLPGLPTHAVYGKLEARAPEGRWRAAAWLDADFAARVHLTRANQPESVVPARVLLGCGARLFHPGSGVTLTLSVKNMMNRTTFTTAADRQAPLADYIGFPLPGRTVLLTLHWRG